MHRWSFDSIIWLSVLQPVVHNKILQPDLDLFLQKLYFWQTVFLSWNSLSNIFYLKELIWLMLTSTYWLNSKLLQWQMSFTSNLSDLQGAQRLSSTLFLVHFNPHSLGPTILSLLEEHKDQAALSFWSILTHFRSDPPLSDYWWSWPKQTDCIYDQK